MRSDINYTEFNQAFPLSTEPKFLVFWACGLRAPEPSDTPSPGSDLDSLTTRLLALRRSNPRLLHPSPDTDSGKMRSQPCAASHWSGAAQSQRAGEEPEV